MKYQQTLYALITGLGIGAAMSVALQDTAVGMAIGFAVGIAFAYSNNSACSGKKTDPDTK